MQDGPTCHVRDAITAERGLASEGGWAAVPDHKGAWGPRGAMCVCVCHVCAVCVLCVRVCVSVVCVRVWVCMHMHIARACYCAVDSSEGSLLQHSLCAHLVAHVLAAVVEERARVLEEDLRRLVVDAHDGCVRRARAGGGVRTEREVGADDDCGLGKGRRRGEAALAVA